jgi:hypothetical protein
MNGAQLYPHLGYEQRGLLQIYARYMSWEEFSTQTM